MGLKFFKDGDDDIVVLEDVVGYSTKKICYPDVSTCITITALTHARLIGTHITVSTSEDKVKSNLKFIRDNGGANCQIIYVFGAISEFKEKGPRNNPPNKAFNSRKKIRDGIKSIVNKNATVKFYDTSTSGKVHLFVEKENGNTKFFWIQSASNLIDAGKYPSIDNKNAIDPSQFVTR